MCFFFLTCSKMHWKLWAKRTSRCPNWKLLFCNKKIQVGRGVKSSQQQSTVWEHTFLCQCRPLDDSEHLILIRRGGGWDAGFRAFCQPNHICVRKLPLTCRTNELFYCTRVSNSTSFEITQSGQEVARNAARLTVWRHSHCFLPVTATWAAYERLSSNQNRNVSC